MEHLVHGIEHHVRVHPNPFLVAGHTHLMIICRHLKVSETFVYVPPKMFAVFAKCGIEMPPKDDSKPVNKNKII